VSSTYAGDSTSFPATFTIPSDGDGPIKAADVNVAFEALGDRTASLNAHITSTLSTPISNAALQAINTTSTVAGTVQNTVDGLYRFSSTSPPTDVASAFPWLVKPTTGPGVWVLEHWITDRGTLAIGAQAIPNALTFLDNSDPADGEMGGPTQFSYGVIGPDGFTPAIFVRQSSGFIASSINANPALDGGPGRGSHYGTTVDLTSVLAPFIGLKITAATLWVTAQSTSYVSSLPNVMPAFGLVAFDQVTGARYTLNSSDAPARDTSASVSAFKTRHALAYTTNQNNRILGNPIQARIFTEGGANAAAQTLFGGISIALSVF
jgi:hypothetical protein